MYSIRKAYKEDFEKVYPLFQFFNNENISKEQWANLFKPICKELNNDFFGFILEKKENKEIIGFIGIILSLREINNKIYLIGNHSSLVLKPEFRGRNLSSLLMNAIGDIEGLHIQSLTPIKERFPKYINCGYKFNTNNYYTIIPYPFFFHLSKKQKIYFNSQEILSLLNCKDLKIYNDHQLKNCNHILFKTKNDYCYFILKPTLFSHQILNSSKLWIFISKVWYKLFNRNLIQSKISLGMIHYVSNPYLFSKKINIWGYTICKRFKIKGLSVKKSNLEKIKFNFLLNTKNSLGAFKSNELLADDFDTLYSDLILFDLDL